MNTIAQLITAAARRLSTCSTLLMLYLIMLAMPAAAAIGTPVALNVPVPISGNIAAGTTTLDVPFTVGGADRLAFDLIVPVNGASLSLIDPSGKVAMGPADPRLTFEPGSALATPLPGGVFAGRDVLTPAPGIWVLRLSFPAAPVKTVAFGTVLAHSRYQVGIAIERNTLLVGEDVSVGMVVLDDGVPITGLSPTISIGSGAPGSPMQASDNGRAPDGLANDGVYSVDYTFAAAGTYSITGTARIATPAGMVERVATAQVRALAPSISATATSFDIVRGAGNCVAALKVTLNVDVRKAGRYSTLIRLSASNGRYIDVRKAKDYAVGAGTAIATFDASSIKAKLGIDGPYNVAQIDMLEVGPEELVLAYRKRDAGSFNVDLAALCSAAIELQAQLTATPVLRDGYIGSFTLSFPVKVAAAGFYQISFKIVGRDGADIGLANASRQLVAGTNNIAVDFASDNFLAVDGPYRAISLLVTGGGASARLSELGATGAYSRWQFFPKKNGDLDGNGSIDPADVAVITQNRGLRALIPGDRRDINHDGVIDIRDARALQDLR
jgi:hypothetical protein